MVHCISSWKTTAELTEYFRLTESEPVLENGTVVTFVPHEDTSPPLFDISGTFELQGLNLVTNARNVEVYLDDEYFTTLRGTPIHIDRLPTQDYCKYYQVHSSLKVPKQCQLIRLKFLSLPKESKTCLYLSNLTLKGRELEVQLHQKSQPEAFDFSALKSVINSLNAPQTEIDLNALRKLIDGESPASLAFHQFLPNLTEVNNESIMTGTTVETSKRCTASDSVAYSSTATGDLESKAAWQREIEHALFEKIEARLTQIESRFNTRLGIIEKKVTELQNHVNRMMK